MTCHLTPPTIHNEHVPIIPYIMNTSAFTSLVNHDIDWVASVAGDLFEGLFEQAHKDLSKGRGSAYFWIACPKSSLYSFLSQVFEDTPAPGRVASAPGTASAIRRGNLPDVPLAGITHLVIDTDNASFWYGAPRALGKKRYIHKLSFMLDKLEYVEGAIENGVDVSITGYYEQAFRKVLRIFLEARLGNFATESAAMLEAESALSRLRLSYEPPLV